MDDGVLMLCNVAVVLTAAITPLVTRGRTAAVVLLAASLFALCMNVLSHERSDRA